MAQPEEEFLKEEANRYSRHFVLPDFGKASQYKLKTAHVTVVGAGGLGNPVLQYLAAAGVGQLQIIDFDTVSISNLQRQVLFQTDDIDKPKATIAAKRLAALNPMVEFKPVLQKITSTNAIELLQHTDVVVDCTDNFPTRYLLNDACVLMDIPYVYGSVFRYEGQLAVFNYKQGPNYRDLYPTPPQADSVPNCEAGGVLGVLTGIIGCLQANEVIKIITRFASPLSGEVLLVDSATLEFQHLKVPQRNSRQLIKSLIDYDEFCGTKTKAIMKEVTVQELKSLLDTKADFQLIDVREPHEFDICNLNGELIPQGDIPTSVDKIAKDKQVVIHCRSGARSGNMVQWLEKNHGFTNLYNLKGGITAWAKEIDTSMPTY